MTSFLKKNILLVIAFGLPVIFVGGIALTVYLPGVSTAYDFVYASCGKNYYYDEICNNYLNHIYVVENGKLVSNPIVDPAQDINQNKIPDANEFTARFFLHDTAKNESREITLCEAQVLKQIKVVASRFLLDAYARHRLYSWYLPNGQ